MVPQSKIGKTFGLKEHLQRYLHLPPSKGTSRARTRDLSDSRPVFFPLDQTFGVIYYFFLNEKTTMRFKKKLI
jgi:hypothetical protein